MLLALAGMNASGLVMPPVLFTLTMLLTPLSICVTSVLRFAFVVTSVVEESRVLGVDVRISASASKIDTVTEGEWCDASTFMTCDDFRRLSESLKFEEDNVLRV